MMKATDLRLFAACLVLGAAGCAAPPEEPTGASATTTSTSGPTSTSTGTTTSTNTNSTGTQNTTGHEITSATGSSGTTSSTNTNSTGTPNTTGHEITSATGSSGTSSTGTSGDATTTSTSGTSGSGGVDRCAGAMHVAVGSSLTASTCDGTPGVGGNPCEDNGNPVINVVVDDPGNVAFEFQISGGYSAMGYYACDSVDSEECEFSGGANSYMFNTGMDIFGIQRVDAPCGDFTFTVTAL